MARGPCLKWRDTIEGTPAARVPPGVHYNLWLGPAPKDEFRRNRTPCNWPSLWDYGNIDLGSRGVHRLHIARWGLGVTCLTNVGAVGGHFMFHGAQETPNTITALFDFEVGARRSARFARFSTGFRTASPGSAKSGGEATRVP